MSHSKETKRTEILKKIKSEITIFASVESTQWKEPYFTVGSIVGPSQKRQSTENS